MATEPFYLPDTLPSADEHRLYFAYADELEDAGLRTQFPSDAAIRAATIELLAERHKIDELVARPELIAEAVDDAVLEDRDEYDDA